MNAAFRPAKVWDSSESSWRHILILGVLLAVLLDFRQSTAGAPSPSQDSPKIRALVIGMTDYADGPLRHAAPNAIRICNAITNSYPSAEVSLLVDSTATLEKVEESLFRKIASVPAGSLVIIYFAGHGIREGEDLRLLLSGATQSRYYGASILVQELLSAVRQAKLCTAMIFLDCCFSGGQPLIIQIPQEEVGYLDSRAFMLTSSYTNEISIGGIFTQALLDVWNTATDDQFCLTPATLEQKVQALVFQKSGGLMTSGLAFGDKVKRCFAELTKPACLMVFRFPNGCRYPLEFFWNEEKAFEVFYPKDRIFYRQVPKQPIKVRVVGQGSNLWEHVFAAADLLPDHLMVDIPLTQDYALQSSEFQVGFKEAVAGVIETYGAESNEVAHLYADAIETSHSLMPEKNISKLVAKLGVYSGENPIYRLASGPVNQADFEAAVQLQQQTNVLSLIESVKKNLLAAEISERAASNAVLATHQGRNPASSDDSEITFNQFRAALNYKVAGQETKCSFIVKKLQDSGLTTAQSNCLFHISKATAKSLQESLGVICTSSRDWEHLGN